jgi:hypothetical protein
MKENLGILLTLGMDLKLLCRLRELILRELGFNDIFKKVKVSSKKISLTWANFVIHGYDNLWS